MLLQDEELKRIFKGYSCIAYDTNCIISYVFRATIKIERTGEEITIEEDPFTQVAKDLTHYIRAHNKKIITIKSVLGELLQDKLAKIVYKKFSDPSFVKMIAMKAGPDEYQARKYIIAKNILDKITRDVKNLVSGSTNWFMIDRLYSSKPTDINNLKRFFGSLFQNPVTKPRFKPYKNPIPFDVDLSLILFSKEATCPLISNDSDITEFKGELVQNNYTHKIIPLMGFSVP